MNWVTWEGGSGSWHYAQDEYEIFVYDGIDITQVTLNDFQDHKPMINENGDITWYGGYDGGRLEIYTSNSHFDFFKFFSFL